MTDEKMRLLRELDETRAELWAVLEAIDPAAEIFPGWNKRDFFAHIAGWEAWAFKTFRDHEAGIPYDRSRYPMFDDANAHFVAERRSAGVETVKLECEINRFALRQCLLDTPPEGFNLPFQLPWSDQNIASFVNGAIDHERTHARELREMIEAGKFAAQRSG